MISQRASAALITEIAISDRPPTNGAATAAKRAIETAILISQRRVRAS